MNKTIETVIKERREKFRAMSNNEIKDQLDQQVATTIENRQEQLWWDNNADRVIRVAGDLLAGSKGLRHSPVSEAVDKAIEVVKEVTARIPVEDRYG